MNQDPNKFIHVPTAEYDSEATNPYGSPPVTAEVTEPTHAPTEGTQVPQYDPVGVRPEFVGGPLTKKLVDGLVTHDSPAGMEAPVNPVDQSKSHRGRNIFIATGAALAGAGIAVGAVLGLGHKGSDSHEAGPTGKPTTAGSTPNAGNTAPSSSISTAPTQESPTNLPSSVEAPAPGTETSTGDIDMTQATAGNSTISLEGDSIHIQKSTPNSSGVELLNSFLSQDAYTLYEGVETGGQSDGLESSVQKVKQAMSDSPVVLAQIQQNIDQWVQQVGTVAKGNAIPIYWGEGLTVTKTVADDGTITVEMSPDSTPVSLNILTRGDPNSPVQDPQWGDQRGHNVATARLITGIKLTYKGVTSTGTPNLEDWRWTVS